MTTTGYGSRTVVGVDVGGTRTKVVALSLSWVDGSPSAPMDGVVTAEHVLPTPEGVGDRLADHVREAVTAVLVPDARPAAVGVVVPGLVHDRSGVGVWSANLGWRDLPLRQLVEDAVGERGAVAVAVGHDVRAGLVGEHRFGAARGLDDVLFVPLGTGVAAAVLTGGQPVAGSPWTGEVGHVVVDPDGPGCGCGARGCLEALAGAGALARRWQEATGGPGDAQVVARLAATGEPTAVRLWDEAVAALVTVLAPVVAANGTELVLVGGGLSNAGDQLLTPLRTGLLARLPGRELVVARAALGDRAAALGAAAMAADRLAASS